MNQVSTESIDVFFNAKSVAIYGASASQNIGVIKKIKVFIVKTKPIITLSKLLR